ncbi:RagB/SusD family nutrient uptake outer membrane protein [Sphingobacterium sp. xlx-130]|uniref:RagB/SusD family nutrient uptake outer membrane protein n=1 Tax=Sphingobacterium sp. xlx-130 TaxID=2654323 RepID=UPI0013DB1CDA|nr:RagB/SusD family nutrient uptake outer membrane protein [Sphingobacterium sp. xlx-130]
MKILSSLLLTLLLLMTVSCDKWLDVTPKSEMKAEQLFSSQAGFRDALIGIYALMTDKNSYGVNLTYGAADVLAQTYDNVRSTSGHSYEFFSKYEYDNANVESTLAAIWKQQYRGIVNANIILSQIDEKESVFRGNGYQIIKGETLALRALLHFDLLRLFSLPPSLGLGSPGIPYADKYTNVPFPQSTVEENLNRIIADLKNAQSLLRAVDPFGPNATNIDLEDQLLKNRHYRLNYYAVTTLLARVYLYQGNNNMAVEAANEVINSGFFKLFEATGGIPSSQFIFPQELMFSIHIPGIKTKYLDTYFPEITQTTNAKSFTINNSTIDAIYPAGLNTDFRKYWFDIATTNSMRIVKFNYSNLVPILKFSECYLIAAECSIDPKQGGEYLNTLRAHRGNAPLAIENITAETLDAEIQKEYRREFIGEGQLFFTYKRLALSKLPNILAFDDLTKIYSMPIPQVEIEFGNIKE